MSGVDLSTYFALKRATADGTPEYFANPPDGLCWEPDIFCAKWMSEEVAELQQTQLWALGVDTERVCVRDALPPAGGEES